MMRNAHFFTGEHELHVCKAYSTTEKLASHVCKVHFFGEEYGLFEWDGGFVRNSLNTITMVKKLNRYTTLPFLLDMLERKGREFHLLHGKIQ